MRRLAAAATPGPWTAENEYRMLPGCRCLTCHEDEPYGKAIHDLDGMGQDISPILSPGNAEYIASWSPDKALLIADLLEGAAVREEEYRAWVPSGHTPSDDPSPGEEAALALAVARVYLGRTDG